MWTPSPGFPWKIRPTQQTITADGSTVDLVSPAGITVSSSLFLIQCICSPHPTTVVPQCFWNYFLILHKVTFQGLHEHGTKSTWKKRSWGARSPQPQSSLQTPTHAHNISNNSDYRKQKLLTLHNSSTKNFHMYSLRPQNHTLQKRKLLKTFCDWSNLTELPKAMPGFHSEYPKPNLIPLQWYMSASHLGPGMIPFFPLHIIWPVPRCPGGCLFKLKYTLTHLLLISAPCKNPPAPNT